jgi:hypothetical protein
MARKAKKSKKKTKAKKVAKRELNLRPLRPENGGQFLSL